MFQADAVAGRRATVSDDHQTAVADRLFCHWFDSAVLWRPLSTSYKTKSPRQYLTTPLPICCEFYNYFAYSIGRSQGHNYT